MKHINLSTFIMKFCNITRHSIVWVLKMPIQVYRREDAVAYARKWAYRRNPAYYDFQLLGGDCTNFASQCIFAGAGVMNYTPDTGWYYISPSNRAPAWTGVEFLHRFLVSNQGAGPFAVETTPAEAQPGDIVQLAGRDRDWYHTLVIVSTQPEIRVAAHTYDVWNKKLEDYHYDYARFLHIEGVRT